MKRKKLSHKANFVTAIENDVIMQKRRRYGKSRGI